MQRPQDTPRPGAKNKLRKSNKTMNTKSKLREHLVNVALNSKEFKDEINEILNEIKSAAIKAENEATIESLFERVLYALLKDIGIKFNPIKESAVATKRHISKGRMDSRIGAVIIEYKHHSKLKSQKDISSAINQIKTYLAALSLIENTLMVGFITDGISICEIRFISGECVSEGVLQHIDSNSLLRFIQSVVALDKTALSSKNLIRDFCSDSYDGILFKVARRLNSILFSKAAAKTKMLMSEWEELFRLAHDDVSQQKRIQDRRKVLSEIFNLDLSNSALEYQTLFSLHTSYAIVLKIIAYRVVSDVHFGKRMQNFKSLASNDSESLRAFCYSLEDGDIFRQLGILNLLEGDFFSWYADKSQWNKDLSNSIQEILNILARYEDISGVFSSTHAIDLFRELYEATVPQVVRAGFGEFYTPQWLAQHVLESSLPSKNCTILDPCSGSGTFVIASISKIRAENTNISKSHLLHLILRSVNAIDLNPLAVLTTRIHYFIHIADLLEESTNKLVIPVYLGDSSYVPEEIKISGISCLKYQLKTLKTPITIEFPVSIVRNTIDFVEIMLKYESDIKNKNEKEALNRLVSRLPKKEAIPEIINRLADLTSQLVNLENKGWNGIWARIITNFLITGCLPKVSNIIGNPPWVDWKNLPSGYRDKVKSLCIDRGLFSGAGRTGGINLNICALITHVCCSNWLREDGILAFLMPKELAYQASYEGWLRAVGGHKHSFLKFIDWSDAGHPFDPVKEDFMTFLIGKQIKNGSTIPVERFKYKGKSSRKPTQWLDIAEAEKYLTKQDAVAGQIIPNSSTFTFAPDVETLSNFKLVAGNCDYIGREGIEFYPQELLLFKYIEDGPKSGTVFVENIQVTKSKYKIPQQRILLETKYLFPLVKGPYITKFKHLYEDILVAFPYDKKTPNKPIDKTELAKLSPLLLSYFKKYETIIRQQTMFSDKIRGPEAGEFYGLARTGPYSFHSIYVAFRDNTKWHSCVVNQEKMPWGEKKRFLFQNHAVSMCERKDESGFINANEAHYVCAILNSPIVEKFIYASSDNRSFKIRPPVYLPKYNPLDDIHNSLAELSIKAHKHNSQIDYIGLECEKLYLKLCKRRKGI